MDSSLVYLVQTDTTVGFLSSDPNRLSEVKQRDSNKKILQTVDSFKTLQQFQRVPNRFKRLVRNKQKTTFIYPSQKAFRVVKEGKHHQFLKKFQILYSSSANITTQEFCFETAMKKSDVVVYSQKPFSQTSASTIIKLGNKKLLKIR